MTISPIFCSLRCLIYGLVMILLLNLDSSFGASVKLTPLKVPGQLRYGTKTFTDVCFLAQSKMEVIQGNNNKKKKDDTVTLCDVLPLILTEDPGDAIELLVNKRKGNANKAKVSMLNSVANRDDGIYDNLQVWVLKLTVALALDFECS
jgi:hypothetical protein